MKRALFFLFAALFILLVVDPNISSNMVPEALKVPVYEEGTVLRTNDDVERQACASQAVIFIDPGRGDKDTGYVADGQIPEKDLAMQVALNIGDALEKVGYQIVYSRYYDDVPACSTSEECDQVRLQKAREANADYILSIRFNQDTPLHRGFSVFTQPDNQGLYDLSKAIVSQIQATSYSMYEGLDTDHYDSFPILSDLNMPAVLLQLGYVTNTSDYSKISDSRFQDRIANAVTLAFLETVN